MDAVIIVFVMATGFVAVTVVLPIIFWFTQTNTFNQTSIRPAENPNNSYFQTKPLPTPQPRPTSYMNQSNIHNHQDFQVKALPPYSVKRSPNRRMAVAS
ncbi:MAG: hypothetical protein ABSD99_06160 [Candidatus Bathyarchaeia archaeon]